MSTAATEAPSTDSDSELTVRQLESFASAGKHRQSDLPIIYKYNLEAFWIWNNKGHIVKKSPSLALNSPLLSVLSPAET